MLRFLEVMPVFLANAMLAGVVIAVGVALAERALPSTFARLAYVATLGAIVGVIAWGIVMTGEPSLAHLSADTNKVAVAHDFPLDRLASVLVGLTWSAGVIVLVFRDLLAHRRRARNRLSWRRETGGLAEFGWPESIPIYWTPDDGPAAIGGRDAGLVLPEAWFTSQSSAAKRALLAHELAHLRLRDPELDMAVRILCLVFWPVLPLWWMYREARALREMAADRAVVDSGAATSTDLASILVDAAETRRAPAGIPFTGYSMMRRRVLALLRVPRPLIPRLCLAAASLIASALLLSLVPRFTNDVLRTAVLMIPADATPGYRDAAVSLNSVFAQTQFRNYSADETTFGALKGKAADVIDPLRDALTAPDATTRAAATWVVGELKEPRLLSEVNRLKSDENPTVRDIAVVVVSRIAKDAENGRRK